MRNLERFVNSAVGAGIALIGIELAKAGINVVKEKQVLNKIGQHFKKVKDVNETKHV